MRLKDKVAIITGGARGLGQAFAKRFAQEGAKIVVCDIHDCSATAEEVRALGAEVLTLKTDVSQEDSTREMAQQTIERFGRIDILVNNAGMFGNIDRKGFVKPIEEITPQDWDRVLAVNVKGVFLCCQAVAPYMKKQRYGKIVNIASTTGLTGLPYFVHYSTSKGAVITLTRAMARSLGDDNIHVNAICPGLTWTDAARSLKSDEFVYQEAEANQVIKRVIQPEDIANAVLFLASDEANAVTGATLAVNLGEFLH